MVKKIEVSKATLGKKEVKAVSDVLLKDGYLGMGSQVQSFEKELQAFFKTDRDVVCFNSGTAALHLAVASLTNPGDEVLVQTITYVASFQAITAAGAMPVACETDPETITIDLEDAQKRITPKTKAIMPVHYASDPGNLKEIYAFAKKHNLRVIEDAAHAFGTVYNKKIIGSFGDIVCFSFDGIKNITCGEGGALITRDKKVVQYAQDARLLGVQKDTEKRYLRTRSYHFDVAHQGYRYHMSNIHAAIGRVQLQKFETLKHARQALAKRYDKLLGNIEGIEIFSKDFNIIVPHIYAIKVLYGKRDALKKYLAEYGIESAIHYYPNHLLQYFKSPYPLPISEKIYEQLLTIPLHANLTKRQQDSIVKHIKKFLNK